MVSALRNSPVSSSPWTTTLRTLSSTRRLSNSLTGICVYWLLVLLSNMNSRTASAMNRTQPNSPRCQPKPLGSLLSAHEAVFAQSGVIRRRRLEVAPFAQYLPAAQVLPYKVYEDRDDLFLGKGRQVVPADCIDGNLDDLPLQDGVGLLPRHHLI